MLHKYQKNIEKNNKIELVNFYKKRRDWDIKWKKIDEEQLADKRDEINTKYSDICKGALDANNHAVKRASKALKIYKDNTFSDEEIDSYLPVELRKKQK